MTDNEEATLNIGALSSATGVPVETIRTWERRYGFPKSQRNRAGHRIYEMDTIESLRLITAILAQGYRPSQLKGQSREELAELLARSTGDDSDCFGDDEEWTREWVGAVMELDRRKFRSYLRCEFSKKNAIDFLEQRVDPFLVELGKRWANGKLKVAHEHFASECLRDFLVDTWRPLNDLSGGPVAVLAALPGEQHCLGLHMAAMVISIADYQGIFLGSNTPVDAIKVAVSETGASTVIVSISEYMSAATATAFLEDLRGTIEPGIVVVAGGRGAPGGVTGIEFPGSLSKLYSFLDNRT